MWRGLWGWLVDSGFESADRECIDVIVGRRPGCCNLEALYAVCRWVPIYCLWPSNLRDQDDNFLIELALAGNAQVIVTNNVKDFRQAELSFDQLHIVTPTELLRSK